MLRHHICLLTLPRHCVVPETLTTILIKKMPLRHGHRYKMQNGDCGLTTKRKLRRKTVFFFFLTNSVFSLSRHQNIKMQTSQYRKSRIWEMKEDK